jgi:hypothetical protein
LNIASHSCAELELVITELELLPLSEDEEPLEEGRELLELLGLGLKTLEEDGLAVPTSLEDNEPSFQPDEDISVPELIFGWLLPLSLSEEQPKVSVKVNPRVANTMFLIGVLHSVNSGSDNKIYKKMTNEILTQNEPFLGFILKIL